MPVVVEGLSSASPHLSIPSAIWPHIQGSSALQVEAAGSMLSDPITHHHSRKAGHIQLY